MKVIMFSVFFVTILSLAACGIPQMLEPVNAPAARAPKSPTAPVVAAVEPERSFISIEKWLKNGDIRYQESYFTPISGNPASLHVHTPVSLLKEAPTVLKVVFEVPEKFATMDQARLKAEIGCMRFGEPFYFWPLSVPVDMPAQREVGKFVRTAYLNNREDIFFICGNLKAAIAMCLTDPQSGQKLQSIQLDLVPDPSDY